MALTLTKQTQVLTILHKSITATPVDWEALMSAVKSEVQIKNWLDVRGVLQFLIDQKVVMRIDRADVEQYVKFTK